MASQSSDILFSPPQIEDSLDAQMSRVRRDGFWDFRSTLISCGRDIFEKALIEPESLAKLNRDVGENLQVEGLQYIARKVARRLGGHLLDRVQPYPKEPSGKKWEEADAARLYPKLAKKYDFK